MKKLFFGFSLFLLSVTAAYLFFVSLNIFSPKVSGLDNKTTKVGNNIPAAYEISSYTSIKQESEKVIAASAKDKVKGKIITKTIGKEGANLSYKNIYIKNCSSFKVDIKTELLKGLTFNLSDKASPSVLIVHTHTTECFMEEKKSFYTEADLTRTTNDNKNIVAVGEALKEGLEKKGIKVIHATEKHDYPEYTGSYNRAATTIKNYLKKHPTIKVVIDLHRDSVTAADGTKTALVTEIDKESAAQLMLVSGCQGEGVESFENWRQNFRLALKLQQTLEIMYPTLARPIYFVDRRYNQHITTGSLLIECGTEANTLDEAKYSATLLANALSMVLKNL